MKAMHYLSSTQTNDHDFQGLKVVKQNFYTFQNLKNSQIVVDFPMCFQKEL